MLDSWIRIDADGAVTVFTGKAELGQGIKTALMQVAAEELGVAIAAHHARHRRYGAQRPDEGYTAGSQSMPNSGTAIRNAAAQVREILLARAAERLSVNAERTQDPRRHLIADDGRSVGFGELVADEVLHVAAPAAHRRCKEPRPIRVVGKPVAARRHSRQSTGGGAYVQDLRLPGHAARAGGTAAELWRAPRCRSTPAEVETMPGVLKVVRDGNFLAVIAGREYQAVQAMWALAQAARWIDDEHGTARSSGDLRLSREAAVARHHRSSIAA